MKKIILITFVFLLFGCSEQIKVPDVIGIDENTAKEILISNKLIPKIKYEYHNENEVGTVFKIDPKENVKVELNEPINLYVNLGPEYMESKNSVLSWNYMTNNSNDQWDFYSPVVQKEFFTVILIPNIEVNQSLKWENFCNVSMYENYSDSVICSFNYNINNYVLEFDTTKLGNRNPTELYIELNYSLDGNENQYKIDFKIAW